MNFLTTILGTLTPRIRVALVGGALGVSLLVVPASMTTAPAHANAAKPAHTHSNTTMAVQAIFGASSAQSAQLRRPASDVYHVSKSYIEKMKDKCRHEFKKRHKRKICVKAQSARGVQTRYFVAHYRVKYFWIKHQNNKRLAKKCKNHHKWCAHHRAFRFMTIANCGHVPWAGPKWHFRYACLKWRAQDWYDRWMNLKFYHNHTVPSDTTAKLRLANATYGVYDTTHTVIIKDFDFFGGPNTIIKFSRSATVNAYHNVWAADSALAAANGLCVAAGVAARTSYLAIACSGLATATIGKVKGDLTNAYNEGRCLQLKYYDIYAIGPVTNIRNAFPSSVTDCVSSKMARRR